MHFTITFSNFTPNEETSKAGKRAKTVGGGVSPLMVSLEFILSAAEGKDMSGQRG